MIEKSNFNTEVTEIEGKITSISGLATKTELTAVENKVPIVSNLVKKSKITEIEKKINEHKYGQYIATSGFNKLSAENFVARIKQANLVDKTDFDTKLTSLNRKINSNKTNHLVGGNELKKLKAFDLSYFRGKTFFGNDGSQNMFVYQPTLDTLKTKYEKTSGNVINWKSKGVCTSNLKPLHGAFLPKLRYSSKKM